MPTIIFVPLIIICAAYKMGEWDKAIKACEKSLEINPDNKLARNNLNWARSQKNK